MKRLLAPLVLLFATAAASAQAFAGPGGVVQLGAITTTGQLGPVISYMLYSSAPSNYTIDWSVDGVAPTACTFQGEGSSDGTHWYSLTGPLDCTTANMQHVPLRPVALFRINVLTFTGTPGVVSVRYTRGVQ